MHVESNVHLCPISLKSSKIQWSHAAAPLMPWFSSEHSVCVWCGGLQNIDFIGFIPGLFPPFLLWEEVGSSPPCPLHREGDLTGVLYGPLHSRGTGSGGAAAVSVSCGPAL